MKIVVVVASLMAFSHCLAAEEDIEIVAGETASRADDDRNYFPVVEENNNNSTASRNNDDDFDIVAGIDSKASPLDMDDDVGPFDEELTIEELRNRQEQIQKTLLVDGIPHDISGPNKPGFRLPLLNESQQIREGKILIVGDIPTDNSNKDTAGFRLPTTENNSESDVKVVIIEPKEEEDDEDSVIISLGKIEQADCFAERDPGSCNDSVESYFYDHNDNQCHFFIYSGCGGNSNRFTTKAECSRHCQDSKPDGQPVKKVCSSRSEGAPVCQHGCFLLQSEETGCFECNCNVDKSACLDDPAKRGLCRAALMFWTYHQDKNECLQFLYGGCESGSNKNKFKTKEHCEAVCLNN